MTQTKIELVKTDRMEMEYFKFGQGEKTLVILPGLSLQNVMLLADAVEEAYACMKDAFTIYVFERRKNLPVDYTIKEIAEDVAKAIEILDLKPVYLFGTSFGGMIAIELAANYLELVERVVVGSTSANVTDEQFQIFAQWIKLAKEKNYLDLCLSFGENVYPKEIFENNKQAFIDMANAIRDEDVVRFITLAKSMKNYQALDDVKRIQCPMLVIGDKTDRIFGQEGSKDIVSGIKENIEIYFYEGYGHAVYDLAPNYKDRLIEFYTK